MQFLNKKTQKYVQERIPWESNVPYSRHSGSKKLIDQSRSASAESPTFRSESDSPVRRRRHSNEMEAVRPSSIGEEELQLQLALAMSREEHEEELRKQKSDDIKLQLAIDESKRGASDDAPATLAGLADRSRQKQREPWGAASSTKQSDPWGASLPAPPGSHHKQQAAPAQKNDPWVSPAHQPPPPADPWSSPSHEQKPADPWSPPPSQQSAPWAGPQASAIPPAEGGPPPFDTFQAPATNGTSNGMGNNIDEAFDVLGTRTSPAKSSSSTAEVTTDPWNLSGMDSSLVDGQPKRNKTPQEFLGANSNLVNLDELVKPDQTSKKANNPFSAPASSTNPFEQTAPPRVPMSQLQTNVYNTGFSQPSQSGLLPAPMVPMATQGVPQQQSSNPFL